MTKTSTPKVTVEKQENSTVVITGSINQELLENHRTEAVRAIGSTLKIDGFRPGKIPTEMIMKQAGELTILEEMAHRALSKWYPEIVIEHNIEAIGRPEIKITKLALGNPLEFTVTTAVMPTVNLGDYKNIAKIANKKDRPIEVTNTEVEEAITQLRKFRAQAQMDEDKSKAAKESGEKFVPTKLEEVDEKELPELTLEYVQAMGDFESLDDFKTKLTANLKYEKEKRAQEERRMEIVDTIIKKTTFDIPELLISYELDRQFAQLEHDIAMSGLEFEQYLGNIQKSKEDLRQDMRPGAVKRAQIRLVIESVAREEGISPDAAIVDKEVTTLLDMYKDNPNASEESIRAYVTETLLNHAVFEYFDGLK